MMNINLIRRSVSLAICLVATACAMPAGAQGNWPNRPITLIVPFAPGTATDVVARALATRLADSLKTSVVVENRAGAGAQLGASAVAKAAPDGYTFLMGSSTTHAANASLYKKLSYDPITDFEPIGLLGDIPQVMVVNPGSPAKTVQEFIAFAHARRGKVNYAQGSSGNLIPAALLNSRKDLGMTMVSYKSPPQALVDVMGGTADMMFADMTASHANIVGGKLRALAVTSAQASALLPGVPPLADTLPGFELTSWIAMWAPAKTPMPIVQQMSKAVLRALADPSLAQQLNSTGFRIKSSSPADLGLLVGKETIKWAKWVKEAGLEAQ